MPHSNHERLERNKKETKANVEAVSAKNLATTVHNVEKKLQDASQSIAEVLFAGGSTGGNGYDAVKGAYSQAILSIEEARDNNRSVAWSIAKHADGTEDLIRDARNVSGPIPDESPGSFAMQYLNLSRGAELVLDTSDISEDQKKIARMAIRKKAQGVVSMLNSNARKTLNAEKTKALNDELCKVLERSGVQGSKARLNTAKEFANLDDPHRHTTTISSAIDVNGARRVVAESDVMMLGLTEAQKAEYKLIQGGSGNKVEWFKALPSYQQLVQRYAGDVAEGTKVLPNQLLDVIPGLKNAYSKVTSVNKDGKMETMHSGAVIYRGKDKAINAKVAVETAEQLKSFVPEDKGILINTLNTKGVPGLSDPDIVYTARGLGAKDNRLSFANTPFNYGRKIPGTKDFSGYKTALKEVAKFAQGSGLANTYHFLNEGKSKSFAGLGTRARLEAAKKEISAINDPKLKQLLSDAVIAQEYMEHGKKLTIANLIGRENTTQLEITAKMKQVAYEINTEDFKKFGVNVDLVNTHCKSGKDRTGIAESHSSWEASSAALGYDLEKTQDREKARANIKSQINAGHTAMMANHQGGTRGNYGVLPHTTAQTQTSLELLRNRDI